MPIGEKTRRLPRPWRYVVPVVVLTLALTALGCHGTVHAPHEAKMGPAYDRPFPLGQVTDAHWETMQTNAEASDFIFYDHEFEGQTAELTPLGKKHLLSVALRLEHVPFPIVVEELPQGKHPKLCLARREQIIDLLGQLGYAKEQVAGRVIIAPALSRGLTAIEGEASYYRTLNDSYGGAGRGSGYGSNFHGGASYR